MRNYSVFIPTYNNSDTILETLDSMLCIRRREYLQVVISDDASTDDTVPLARAWINDNAHEFRSICLDEHDNNHGISANHQAAFLKCDAEYCFYIGGDDVIRNPNILTALDSWLDKNPDLHIGKMEIKSWYPGDSVRNTFVMIKSFFNKEAMKQFGIIAILGNILPGGPGTLVKRDTLVRLEGFDTQVRTYEDKTLYLKFMLAGYPLKYINVKGIYWRRHQGSLSSGGFKSRRQEFLDDDRYIINTYLKPNIMKISIFKRIILRLIIKEMPVSAIKALRLLYWDWWEYTLLPMLARRLITRRVQ